MNKKAFVKYLSALLLFGLNGIVASRIALTSYEIVLLRTFIGSVLLLILFCAGKGEFHIITYKKDGMYVVLSGMAMGVSWIFLFEAYQQIGVSMATLMYYCGPVIVMILSPLIFKEKLTMTKIVGFVLVLVGLVLVNGNCGTGGGAWGIVCGVMSAVMYCFMVLLNKLSKHIIGMENSVIQLTISFLTVAILMGTKQVGVIKVPANSVMWILILGVVNTGIGCYLYFSSIGQLPVQTVAVCGYFEPLSAVVCAWIFLGERMDKVQIIGAICIIGGAMLGELIKKR